MHSPSLSQREPTAAVTLKNDFPPPRQPNENKKSLTLQFLRASPPICNTLPAAPAVLCPSASKANIPIYKINTALAPLFPNEWMKKLFNQIPGKKTRRAPTCYVPAQGTKQEGEATQNLGFYNNNNIFINDFTSLYSYLIIIANVW